MNIGPGNLFYEVWMKELAPRRREPSVNKLFDPRYNDPDGPGYSPYLEDMREDQVADFLEWERTGDALRPAAREAADAEEVAKDFELPTLTGK
jgi:hypothetical protein